MTKDDESGFAAAVAAAKDADAIVMFLGIDEAIEAESHDRTSIDLPEVQHKLAAQMLKLGKPIVIVLINGGMVAVEEEANAKGSVALLEAFYPGVFGASAIADTIFGKNDHLGGKLPITVYNASYIDDIKMSEMELNVGVGRTYRYFKGQPTFSFGHGLSLTSFSLQLVGGSADEQISSDGKKTASFSVKVTNVGKRIGDEVVQAYFSPKDQNLAPGLTKKLFDYKRVHLSPGESTTVQFTVTREALRIVHQNGDAVAAPGHYALEFTNGVEQHLNTSVEVIGDEFILDKFPNQIPRHVRSNMDSGVMYA